MNDCRHHLTLRIETEIDGAPPPPPHCNECEATARVFVRIVTAGRGLSRVDPPDELVEAGRRRLLQLLRSGGGGGLAAFLALLGGVFLASLTVMSEADRRVAPEAVVTVAVGTAGAAAACVSESRSRRFVPDPEGGSTPSRFAFSPVPAAPGRVIMSRCAPSPSWS